MLLIEKEALKMKSQIPNGRYVSLATRSFNTFKPYLDWAFWQPKKTGGHFGFSPNIAISSQKTMKLVKGILWVEIFTNC